MIKHTLLIGSVGLVLSSSIVFWANTWSLNTGRIELHNNVVQYKSEVTQLRNDYQSKREEIKNKYNDIKSEYATGKVNVKNQIHDFMKTLDKTTIASVKEQAKLMDNAIKAIHTQYQTGSTWWLTIAQITEMTTKIKTVRLQYETSIKNLLPTDKQSQYQSLVDQLEALFDSHVKAMIDKKNEIIDNHNGHFNARTILLQKKYETIITKRINLLKAKGWTGYQEYVNKLETATNNQIDRISKMRNISDTNKNTRLELYNAILWAIDSVNNTSDINAIVINNTLSESL